MRDVLIGGSGMVVGGVIGSGAVLAVEGLMAATVGLTLLLVAPSAETAEAVDLPVAPVAQAAPAQPQAQPQAAPPVQVRAPVAVPDAELEAARRDMEAAAAEMEREMARAEAEIEAANQLVVAQLDALGGDDVRKVNLAPLVGVPVDVPIPKLGFGKRKSRSRK